MFEGNRKLLFLCSRLVYLFSVMSTPVVRQFPMPEILYSLCAYVGYTCVNNASKIESTCKHVVVSSCDGES